jgi:hypothetical protein
MNSLSLSWHSVSKINHTPITFRAHISQRQQKDALHTLRRAQTIFPSKVESFYLSALKRSLTASSCNFGVSTRQKTRLISK